MRTLTAYTLDQIDHLIQPAEFLDATLKSPALNVFHDFRINHPMLIDADTRAFDTEEMMRHERSWLKLVVDSQQEMVGILSHEHFSSQSLMQQAVPAAATGVAPPQRLGRAGQRLIEPRRVAGALLVQLRLQLPGTHLRCR